MKIEARGKGIYVVTPRDPRQGPVRFPVTSPGSPFVALDGPESHPKPRLAVNVDPGPSAPLPIRCGRRSALRNVTGHLDHRQDPGLQVIQKHRPSLDDGCQIAIDVSTPCATLSDDCRFPCGLARCYESCPAYSMLLHHHALRRKASHRQRYQRLSDRCSNLVATPCDGLRAPSAPLSAPLDVRLNRLLVRSQRLSLAGSA